MFPLCPVCLSHDMHELINSAHKAAGLILMPDLATKVNFVSTLVNIIASFHTTELQVDMMFLII